MTERVRRCKLAMLAVGWPLFFLGAYVPGRAGGWLWLVAFGAFLVGIAARDRPPADGSG